MLPKSSVLLCGFIDARTQCKKYFLLMAGSVCRLKRITTGSNSRLKVVSDDARLVADVAEITVEGLLFCGFRRTDKAMGQVYQCLWRICREINVSFSRFEYHTFYDLYPFVAYSLTLPCSFSTPCCSSSHCPSAANAVGKYTNK
jgi:hypothetical protein